MPDQDAALAAALERLRTRLLDLSARNPLLNFRHSSGRSVRFIDEVPSQAFSRLTDGLTMSVVPLVPPAGAADEDSPSLFAQPTAGEALARGRVGGLMAAASDAAARTDAQAAAGDDEEAAHRARGRSTAARAQAQELSGRALAESLGLNPSYDLPAVEAGVEARHQDGALQTLLSAEALETRLRNLQKLAGSYLEEHGANILHLAFGFVEWRDTSKADQPKARHAPLVLLPASLVRGAVDPRTGAYRYTVRATGEDWSVNLTLLEKTKRDFHFELPDADEDEPLETYFQRVAETLRHAPPGWRLHRWMTLGLMSFGKLLMWRDLKPEHWPKGKGPLANPHTRAFLGDGDAVRRVGGTDAGAVRVDPHAIDALPVGPRGAPPLVTDADSSQHSVLVDVASGESLVVQGPPGTGKSQTITNLIAAALAAGQRVLFLAEKKAALDVVHRRLTDANLGPFCLALHSHASDKKAVIQSLGRRLELSHGVRGRRRGAAPGADDAPVAEPPAGFAETRQALTAHAKRINAPFGASGWTPFALFWRARSLLEGLPQSFHGHVRAVRIPRASGRTPMDIADDRQAIDAVSRSLQQLAEAGHTVGRHPWRGTTPADPSPAAHDGILANARTWRRALGAVAETAAALDAVPVGTAGAAPASLARAEGRTARALGALGAAARDCPVPPPGMPAALPWAITELRDASAAVPQALAAVEVSQRAWRAIEGPWGVPGALCPNEAAALGVDLAAATEAVGSQHDILDLERYAQSAQRFADATSEVAELSERLAEAVGVGAPRSLGGMLALVRAAGALRELPADASRLRHPALEETGAAPALRRLHDAAAELRRSGAALDERLAPAFRPGASDLRVHASALATAPRILPGLFSGAYRAAVRAHRAMAGGQRVNRDAMLADLRALVANGDAVEAWSKRAELMRLAGPHLDGLETPLADLAAVADWRARTRAEGIEQPDAGAALDALWGGDEATFERLRSRVGAVRPEAWTAATDVAETAPVVGRLGRVALDGRGAPSSGEKAVLAASATVAREAARRVVDWATAVSRAARAAGVPAGGRLDTLAERLRLVLEALAADAALATSAPVLRTLGVLAEHGGPEAERAERSGETLTGVALDCTPVVRALAYIADVRRGGLPPDLAEWVLRGDSDERSEAVRAAGAALSAACADASEAARAFAASAALDPSDWFGVRGASDQLPVSGQLARLEEALAHADALHGWTRLSRARTAAVGRGLEPVLDLVVRGLPAGDLPAAYEVALVESLIAACFAAEPALAAFSGADQEALRARFRALDGTWMQETRHATVARLLAAPPVPGNGSGSVREYTGEALIAHEARKRRAHVAVRELFRRAGTAILSLTPCVMMSPQTVAQYLTPGGFEFDLVIMDEASQLRPEDALGAIIRAKQVVIVGDPQQLGPSHFFDTVLQEEDEDLVEELDGAPTPEAGDDAAGADGAAGGGSRRGLTATEQQESILTAAAALYPMRVLRWHYRSQHPSLIAFSNRWFYDERLYVFPSARATDATLGVRLHRLTDAVYGGGLNQREAREVLAAIRRHAAETPGETLIVVTMNADQADMIEGLVQAAEKSDPLLSAFRERHAETLEPFAIKALENVQGDERDVVMISLTYGPNLAGRLNQNFGPVNKQGGARRLNVLFSRAKQRLELFASFGSDMLRVEPTSAEGLVVLQDYLRYAEGGAWGMTTLSAREPDSDFERAMIAVLRAHGLDVVPQVGVAGYFIDIGIRHPDHPGRFILGVECDGETYHRAASARDRDRLRDAHLKTLHWELHRVWSTDFFRDPVGEARRIVEKVNAKRNEGSVVAR